MGAKEKLHRRVERDQKPEVVRRANEISAEERGTEARRGATGITNPRPSVSSKTVMRTSAVAHAERRASRDGVVHVELCVRQDRRFGQLRHGHNPRRTCRGHGGREIVCHGNDLVSKRGPQEKAAERGRRGRPEEPDARDRARYAATPFPRLPLTDSRNEPPLPAAAARASFRYRDFRLYVASRLSSPISARRCSASRLAGRSDGDGASGTRSRLRRPRAVRSRLRLLAVAGHVADRLDRART